MTDRTPEELLAYCQKIFKGSATWPECQDVAQFVETHLTQPKAKLTGDEAIQKIGLEYAAQLKALMGAGMSRDLASGALAVLSKAGWFLITEAEQDALDRLTAPVKAEDELCPLYNNEAISRGFGCKGYHGRHDSQYGCRHDKCPMKAASAEPAPSVGLTDTIAIGSIRLQRTFGGAHDRVTVEVEINGQWVEVIRELHSNFFDHFVSPSGMMSAYDKSQAPVDRLLGDGGTR